MVREVNAIKVKLGWVPFTSPPEDVKVWNFGQQDLRDANPGGLQWVLVSGMQMYAVL